MILAVASGKGGTGKTLVATNLASVMGKVRLLDCDVEEPNAHIFLNPEIAEKIEVGTPVPRVDESRCTYCGRCAEICAYHAIVVARRKVLIFPELCHGCGGCAPECPAEAISEEDRPIGVVELGKAGAIAFGHGILNVGELSGIRLIKELKKQMIESPDTVIIDCPPGVSCPMVESVRNADYCILVTEPTPFGLYDLSLTVKFLREMKTPCGVVINRAGLGDGHDLNDYCRRENLPVLAEIPFDREIAEVYSRGGLIVEQVPRYRALFQQLAAQISERK